MKKVIVSSMGAITLFACANFLTANQIVKVPSAASVIKAARKSVGSRSYGVDVSSYQSSSLRSAARQGGKFAVVKVSEGTGYRNPKAYAQIKSAIANNMMPMAYHFAIFGANSSAAAREGNYAVASAKAMGLPRGSYIACDWETGDGNNVNGGRSASTNAILSFMNRVKANGYKPLLYSGAYLLNNNVNTSTILRKYPNALWVASYATMGRIDTPNFNYFPSMNGVLIWQFTDNWRGLNVDGNIALLPLNTKGGSASSQAPTIKGIKHSKKIMYASRVYTKRGKATRKMVYPYRHITVYGGVVNIKGQRYYQIGSNKYIKVNNVDGYSKKLKQSTYVYNNHFQRVNVPYLKAGASVVVYGGTVKINGIKCFRINAGRYVPASAF